MAELDHFEVSCLTLAEVDQAREGAGGPGGVKVTMDDDQAVTKHCKQGSASFRKIRFSHNSLLDFVRPREEG